jgi:hypothetical protein
MQAPFEKAQTLASEGNFKEAWELLFGKSKPLLNQSLTLVESDGKYRAYEEWQKYWKDHQGCRMMTLPDLYSMLDSLTSEQLSSLRKDMRERVIVFSKVKFNGDKVSVDGRVPIACPMYDGVPINNVHETILQYFFNTNDKKDVIISKLLRFSRKEVQNMYLWTPSLDSRKAYPRRTSWLGCGNDNFSLNTSDFLNGNVAARGVLCEAR